MFVFVFVVALLAAATVAVSVSSSSSSSFVVDVCVGCEQQRGFGGFGTSLCWWANGVGRWTNTTAFEDVMQLLFSDTRGLGLSTVRYNIGGGENPQNAHFLRPGALVRGYQGADGTFDWGADYPQRRVLYAALNGSVRQVQAFSNSPPYWMTKSGSATGAVGGSNNLRDDMYGAFAAYLANVTVALAHGPPDQAPRCQQQPPWQPLGDALVSVTPLNEPVSSWWKYGNDQEGCHFDRDKQAAVIAALSSQLRATAPAPSAAGGRGVGVSGPEENSIDDALLSLQSYPAETLAGMDLLTTHTYNGIRREALAAFAQKHGKQLWNSEYGTGSGPLQGGLELASRIITDLHQLNASVWTLWQTVDLDNSLSPDGWGLLAATVHEENLYQIVANRSHDGDDGADGAGASCCVEVEGVADGSNITCSPCDVNNPNQVFSVVDGQVRAHNSSGPCMDDWGQGMRAGDSVRVYSCWGSANQQWVVDAATRRIRLNSTGLCIDMRPTTATAADATDAIASATTTSRPSGTRPQPATSSGVPSATQQQQQLQATLVACDADAHTSVADTPTTAAPTTATSAPSSSSPSSILSATRVSSPRYTFALRSVLDTPGYEPRDRVREAYRVRKQYYAYKQFTRAIPRNSTLLRTNTTASRGDGVVRSVAARWPNGTIAVVLVNTGKVNQTGSVVLSGGSCSTAYATLTDATHSFQPWPVSLTHHSTPTNNHHNNNHNNHNTPSHNTTARVALPPQAILSVFLCGGGVTNICK
ncbi:alpha-L-arabinofuranosidase B [Salpingoeca rosetta]|uniref:Alpha-L-arabinofuranosidase B n=1 Tax=Salpingoeca rosetta (strain ATCC 50818 / BSB-021) TaxID=946362 RepID=F2UNU7_SALR5|nr:alpha-L-arabinofuranosidase B [Salpingoeca rosetta]EGD79302.1 alpha-L-arabinofuranosidase B [Salpingoeca rosetta]|eukprot:XP_004989073.1 alpha-L-arabinofuranosidase B [Salpingoeca rosetta]